MTSLSIFVGTTVSKLDSKHSFSTLLSYVIVEKTNFKPVAVCFSGMFVNIIFFFKLEDKFTVGYHLIPIFHTGPESHELTRIVKYLDSWLNRTQFVKILTDSRSP